MGSNPTISTFILIYFSPSKMDACRYLSQNAAKAQSPLIYSTRNDSGHSPNLITFIENDSIYAVKPYYRLLASSTKRHTCSNVRVAAHSVKCVYVLKSSLKAFQEGNKVQVYMYPFSMKVIMLAHACSQQSAKPSRRRISSTRFVLPGTSSCKRYRTHC